MNAVDICNLALGRIGQGASSLIQSIDPNVDDSEAARACARSFPLAMKLLLREHTWSWAQGSVVLALSSETVPGYAYVYAYPANCAKFHGITPADYDLAQFPVRAWTPLLRRWPYRIVAAADGESALIATHFPSMIAHFTRSNINPAFADSLFHDTLAWKVAKEIALGLRANPGMAQAAAQEYELSLSKAVAANDNEAAESNPSVAEDTLIYLGGARPDYNGDPWG